MGWNISPVIIVLIASLSGISYGSTPGVLQKISVMSWNVLGEHSTTFRDLFPALQRDENWYKDRLLKIFQTIDQDNPDVICLQEVSPWLYGQFQRSIFPYRYIYDGSNGSGLLLGYHQDLFEPHSNQSMISGLVSGVKTISVALRHKKSLQQCLVSCVHLGRSIQRFSSVLRGDKSTMVDNRVRCEMQLTAFLERIRELDHGARPAIIIAGDFNTEAAEMKHVASSLGLSLFNHGSFTFATSTKYLYSIDHVLYSGADIIRSKSYAGDHKGSFLREPFFDADIASRRHKKNQLYELMRDRSWSDHLPVVATFAVRAKAIVARNADHEVDASLECSRVKGIMAGHPEQEANVSLESFQLSLPDFVDQGISDMGNDCAVKHGNDTPAWPRNHDKSKPKS